MFTQIGKVKTHVYLNRAKYTALVTVPVTIIVMNRIYKPYVLVAREMAVFLYEHDLGTKFLERAGKVL
jgi:hypothetical protein